MNPTPGQSGFSGRTPEDGLRFAQRMYRVRPLGVLLGAVCVGGALWEQDAHPLVWATLALNALAWPHLAYWIARRSADPYRAERRNLMLDSASGGAWIAAIGFSAAPSAVIFSMMVMDKVSVGGLRFLARCLAVQAAAAALVALAPGFAPHLQSTLMERIATLPLLVFYPLAIGLTTYRLARRVRGQNQTLAALSSMDGLSGLLNRTNWEAVVAAEFQRCRRIGHPSSVVMIDIDHFKVINDRHGHPVGDAVIRSIARILRGALRLHDVPGRYGGEEFGVVLPGTDIHGATLLAERIRARIESAILHPDTGVRATASLGVAQFEVHDADHVDWIARADRALYAAKRAGRNRTERGVSAEAPAKRA
ncbi:MAG TPA: diguanylate cyclase [Burkholderiales bacterium]|nr:diguanylate cyclase [Burkholderiales bacterium]